MNQEDLQDDIDRVIDILCDLSGLEIDDLTSQDVERITSTIENLCQRVRDDGFEAGVEAEQNGWSETSYAASVYHMRDAANDILVELEDAPWRDRKPCIICDLIGRHTPSCLVPALANASAEI